MTTTPEYDPTFLHTRREAIVIFAAWVVCFLWSVPYCYLYGYGAPAVEPSTLWGIPTWVVWGIAVPWLAADAFTIWMCLRFIADDDLSGPAPEVTGAGEPR
ncbi:MAG: hypothetical protein ABIL09_10790 [Gemmatimonadota bacterium]